MWAGSRKMIPGIRQGRIWLGEPVEIKQDITSKKRPVALYFLPMMRVAEWRKKISLSKITSITVMCLVNEQSLNEMASEWAGGRMGESWLSDRNGPCRLFGVWSGAISAPKKRREEEIPEKIFSGRFLAWKMTLEFYIECCVYKNYMTTLVLVFMMSILVDNFTLKL